MKRSLRGGETAAASRRECSRQVGARRRLEVEPGAHRHERGQRVRLHLAHYLPAVRLHGDLADAELAADLFIEETRRRPAP